MAGIIVAMLIAWILVIWSVQRLARSVPPVQGGVR
jgi:hypothetical protein